MEIAGRKVRALRHGMAGQPGFELMGPWADGAVIHAALVEAGKAHGLTLVGGRVLLLQYPGVGLDTLAPARRLHRRENEALSRMADGESLRGQGFDRGSFVSDKVEDYYLTPWELGYGFFVKFDHDFIGRAALEKMAAGPHRKKVTLALDNVS